MFKSKGLLAILLLFAACRTIQYVPIKQTEYVTVRDSVYLRDTTICEDAEQYCL